MSKAKPIHKPTRPLMVYDVNLDAMRPATQNDIDLMWRRLNEFAQARKLMFGHG